MNWYLVKIRNNCTDEFAGRASSVHERDRVYNVSVSFSCVGMYQHMAAREIVSDAYVCTSCPFSRCKFSPMQYVKRLRSASLQKRFIDFFKFFFPISTPQPPFLLLSIHCDKRPRNQRFKLSISDSGGRRKGIGTRRARWSRRRRRWKLQLTGRSKKVPMLVGRSSHKNWKRETSRKALCSKRPKKPTPRTTSHSNAHVYALTNFHATHKRSREIVASFLVHARTMPSVE